MVRSAGPRSVKGRVMQLVTTISRAAMLGLLAGGTLLYGQQPAPAPAPLPPGGPPAASAQGAPPQRGGGRGGAPLTPEDAAEIAKLNDFPAWTPGAGDGNY